MAATGSDRTHRRPRWRRLARPANLRRRLTTLYALCFLLGAGAVLTITYVVVAQVTGHQAHRLTVHGLDVRSALSSMPSSAPAGSHGLQVQKVQVLPNGEEILQFGSSRDPSRPPAFDKVFNGRLTTTQLAGLRIGERAFERCMRAHGLRYPSAHVTRGPHGNGFRIVTNGSPLTTAESESRSFRKVVPDCAELYVNRVPVVRTGPHPSRASVAALQGQVDVVVNRANQALVTQRNRSLTALLTWSLAALGVIALISILLGWFVAGRGLRPIRVMASRAKRITEENLDERLAVEGRDDELGELARDFDHVLARLERAFAAQQRFVANASHELRTPVTLERTLLELALSAPDPDVESLRRTCEKVLASSKQQHEMIDALLVLARSQAGSTVDSHVDLSDLAGDEMSLRERHLAGLTTLVDLHAAPVRGDAALLQRLVSNLIDNAIAHNTPDGWITIETGSAPDHSWLCVSNSGPKIAEKMVDELFEPFRRLGTARTATTNGVGLGLSIVRAIAEAYDCIIDPTPLVDGGLRVLIQFPDAPPSRAASEADRISRPKLHENWEAQ